MINVPLHSRSGNGYGPMGRIGRIGQNKANRTNWANKANRGMEILQKNADEGERRESRACSEAVSWESQAPGDEITAEFGVREINIYSPKGK